MSDPTWTDLKSQWMTWPASTRARYVRDLLSVLIRCGLGAKFASFDEKDASTHSTMRWIGRGLLAVPLGLVFVALHPHTLTTVPIVRWPLAVVEFSAAVGIGSLVGFGTAPLVDLAVTRGERLALRAVGATLLGLVIGTIQMNPMHVAVAWTCTALMLVFLLLVGYALVSMKFDELKRRPALPPGVQARSLLAFIYSRRSMELVFEPVLGDIQTEWLAQEIAGRRWHARMVRLRGCFQLGQAVAAHGGVSAVKLVVRIWKIT